MSTLANTLATYQQKENITEEEMAQRLSLSIDGLAQLATHEHPPTGPAFGAAVRQIAAATGANLETLAAMLRQVDAVEAFKTPPAPDAMFVHLREHPTSAPPDRF